MRRLRGEDCDSCILATTVYVCGGFEKCRLQLCVSVSIVGRVSRAVVSL
jgi:hypothetical protein